MATFADEILRLRESKGMTQGQLAAAARISRTFVAGIEQGKRTRLGADVLFRLCAALGVPCEHFRPYLDDSAPPPRAARGRPRKG